MAQLHARQKTGPHQQPAALPSAPIAGGGGPGEGRGEMGKKGLPVSDPAEEAAGNGESFAVLSS